LKDAQGGIVAVLVDENLDMKELAVSPTTEPSARQLQSRFVVAMRHGSHAPPVTPGAYDAFVSVGQRDGTPVIALPLPLGDGQRRYKVGRLALR
jgi:hypothetical protein